VKVTCVGKQERRQARVQVPTEMVFGGCRTLEAAGNGLDVGNSGDSLSSIVFR